MEREQYEVMYRREDEHWWYTGMRQVALAVLRRELAGTVAPYLLDAGCGTGGTTIRLSEFGGPVFGVDMSRDALQPAVSRGLAGRLAQGSVERLPFGDASFDVVTSFEVVYHAGVANDVAAIQEFRRVLRPGGLLMLRLPGHDWLRGQHDRLVHTRHRYSRTEVGRKLRDARFTVEFLSWANSILFAPAVTKRLLEAVPISKHDGNGANGSAEPDLWQPPPWLNNVLQRCVTAEAAALERHVGLPFGLSVLALARAA